MGAKSSDWYHLAIEKYSVITAFANEGEDVLNVSLIPLGWTLLWKDLVEYIHVSYHISSVTFSYESQVKAKKNNEKTVGIFFLETFLKYSRTGQELKSGAGERREEWQRGRISHSSMQFTGSSSGEWAWTMSWLLHQHSSANAQVKNTLHSGSFALEGGQKWARGEVVKEQSRNGFLGKRQGDWHCFTAFPFDPLQLPMSLPASDLPHILGGAFYVLCCCFECFLFVFFWTDALNTFLLHFCLQFLNGYFFGLMVWSSQDIIQILFRRTTELTYFLGNKTKCLLRFSYELKSVTKNIAYCVIFLKHLLCALILHS